MEQAIESLKDRETRERLEAEEQKMRELDAEEEERRRMDRDERRHRREHWRDIQRMHG